MKGAILGDIMGSTYESNPVKRKNIDLFPPGTTFTDDTVLTIAVADAIMNNIPYREALHRYARAFPGRGYGGRFLSWIEEDDPVPYNSFGNGSAMRVSAVGWAFGSEEEVLHQAALSAEPSHNHPEGIRGARATALSVYLARNGTGPDGIRETIEQKFGYDLSRTLDEIRPAYSFDVTCQGTVPEAIIAFLESGSYEDAVRNAISLGGDSDTLACITGGIAEAYYMEIPEEIERKGLSYLDRELFEVVERFTKSCHWRIS
ncbi:MAG: ADP-ribosylglycohydrolase family protein [Bacteroidales bacterium]